jgi:hypothetical protein
MTMTKEDYKKVAPELKEKYGIERPIGSDELVIRIEYVEDTEPPAYEFMVGTIEVRSTEMYLGGDLHLEFHALGQGMAADEEALGVALAEALIRFRKKEPDDES